MSAFILTAVMAVLLALTNLVPGSSRVTDRVTWID